MLLKHAPEYTNAFFRAIESLNVKLIATHAEDIPDWLYPGAFRDSTISQEDCLDAPPEIAPNFQKLFEALNLSGVVFVEIAVDPCGLPHDAPDSVQGLTKTFSEAIASIAETERFRVAQTWAGKRAKQSSLAAYKRFLKQVCNLAQRAKDKAQTLVLLP